MGGRNNTTCPVGKTVCTHGNPSQTPQLLLPCHQASFSPFQSSPFARLRVTFIPFQIFWPSGLTISELDAPIMCHTSHKVNPALCGTLIATATPRLESDSQVQASPGRFQTTVKGGGSPERSLSTINGELPWLGLGYLVRNTGGQIICWDFQHYSTCLKRSASAEPVSNRSTRRMPSVLVDFYSSTHETGDTFKMEFNRPR